MWILNWLGLGGAKEDEAGTIRRIGAALEDLRKKDPVEASRLACFAYLLGRVALADHVLEPAETEQMRKMLGRHSEMDAGQIDLVVEIAASEGEQPTRNDEVIRIFADSSSEAQKLALVDCLFAVAAADKDIGEPEIKEIRHILDGLGLGGAALERVQRRHERFLVIEG